jgi:hypothetical protein
MPGGICSKVGQPMGGYSRSAEVTISIAGVLRTVYMAGAAEAFFPDRSDDDLRDLLAGDSFELVWQDSVFHGRDPVLGEVTASLKRGPGAPRTSGLVRSNASVPQQPFELSQGGVDFFPATNRNELHFEFILPRFNAIFDSSAPIINEAVIREIPPFGTIYRLIQPVTLEVDRTRSGFIGSLAPTAEIQTCNVKLLLLGGMSTRVELISDQDGIAECEVTIENQSDAPQVEATWLIWPRPEIAEEQSFGLVTVEGQPVTVRFSVPRDIFYVPRWLVVAGARPFETNAAAAARFPELP